MISWLGRARIERAAPSQNRSNGGGALVPDPDVGRQPIAAAYVSDMFANKGSRSGKRRATVGKTRVPQRPRMNHMRPDLQGHGNVGGAGGGGESGGVGEKRSALTQPGSRSAGSPSFQRKAGRPAGLLGPRRLEDRRPPVPRGSPYVCSGSTASFVASVSPDMVRLPFDGDASHAQAGPISPASLGTDLMSLRSVRRRRCPRPRQCGAPRHPALSGGAEAASASS